MKEKKLKNTEQLILKKKIKKEFEEKLHTAIMAIVNEHGKGKKTKSVIEKFIKQLAKKVDLNSKPAKETKPKVTEKPSAEKATITKPISKPSATKTPKAAPVAKKEQTNAPDKPSTPR